MSPAAIGRRHWLLCALLAALLLALAWGALAPLRFPNQEKLFEIPAGTWERRVKGEPLAILPQEVRLTLGVQDVLLLRNRDAVPQVFGPVLIMPGQEFRLPFEQAGEHLFACNAHASGQMLVRVVPLPDPGFDRLRWRIENLVQTLRHLPLIGPER